MWSGGLSCHFTLLEDNLDSYLLGQIPSWLCISNRDIPSRCIPLQFSPLKEGFYFLYHGIMVVAIVGLICARLYFEWSRELYSFILEFSVWPCFLLSLYFCVYVRVCARRGDGGLFLVLSTEFFFPFALCFLLDLHLSGRILSYIYVFFLVSLREGMRYFLSYSRSTERCATLVLDTWCCNFRVLFYFKS